MCLDLAGDRDRLTVREFSAGDTAKGNLDSSRQHRPGRRWTERGSLGSLGGFRVVGRDEAVLTCKWNGRNHWCDFVPESHARLTTARGDLTIPDNLPPSVTRLQVVEINSRAREARNCSPAKPEPARSARLARYPDRRAGTDLRRGRGLDSEWRGRISVNGTSDAPRAVGSLDAMRGTFDFLGKTV